MKNYIIYNFLRMSYLYFKALFIATFKRKEIVYNKNKIAFVMLGANYNNLGDIAITKYQEEFLKKILPNDYEVIVIPVSETFNVYFSMKKIVNDYTIITLIGGGNSGTLYEFIEWPRRFILEKFKKYKIVSFPQSVYYGDSKISDYYKKAFIKRCNKCKNLTLVARESDSYKRYMDMGFKNVRLLLVPDIVFSAELKKRENSEKKVAIIFRNDCEKEDSFNEKIVFQEIKKEYDKFTIMDTCDVNIKSSGYEELEDYIKKLSEHNVVFTDRLHGMILSYVLGINCIVFDNNNHKIRATVQTWLNQENKVKYYNNVTDYIEKSLPFQKDLKKRELDKEFIKLKEAILYGENKTIL